MNKIKSQNTHYDATINRNTFFFRMKIIDSQLSDQGDSKVIKNIMKFQKNTTRRN